MSSSLPPIDRPRPTRSGEELDSARLQAFLAREVPGFTGPVTIEQFPAGHSNLTYLLQSEAGEWVLRRPPFGASVKSGHDMAREYRILRHLHPVWPKVPCPLAFCEDEAVLGTPFYVMERVRGVILRGSRPRHVELPPERMRRVCEALLDTLVEIHDVDYVAAGLGDLGRPEGYVRRQVEGWTERYRKAQTDDIAGIDAVIQWLPEHLPAVEGAALVHNDFKYDNLVLAPEDLGRVLAVLDWEMATIGDPLMDLGTMLAYWVEAADPEEMHLLGLIPTALPGNLTRAQLIERYAEKTGREVPTPVFYYAFGLFKVAIIAQQIYARFAKGFTKDERFGLLIHAVRILGQAALRAMESGRVSG